MIDTCASCASPATVRLYGKYRNGRETTDYRCDDHRPKASGRSLVDEEARGLWAFHGTSARMFRIEEDRTMTAPHARPMTTDELRAALRNAWDALNTAQRNMDKAAPRTCPWVERALAGELPAPTLAPVVRQPADRITP